MATHIDYTWTWGNPHNPGQTSHWMRVQFDATASYDATTVYVNLTNVNMTGGNGTMPDVGNTQDHIVIAKNGTGLPPTVAAPPRPIALPFPSNLSSLGGFAEMATFINGGNPQRFYWSVSSSESYTVPYVGPTTKVVYGWNSRFVGTNIEWSLAEWFVTLDELDYRPGQIRISSVWQSHNRGAGKADKRSGGAWVTMRTASGPGGTGNPPLIRRSGAWYNQSKIGSGAG